MTEIIIKAYDVADEIIKDSKYSEIKRLNKLIDQLYPNEIEAFEAAKVKYDDVMTTGGKYHPDFKSVTLLLSQTKAALYEKPEVVEYRKLELEFEQELNAYIFEMTSKISDNIPSPDAFGLVKKGGSCHVG